MQRVSSNKQSGGDDMLTELEYEILEKIVAYGGYVTKNMLSFYRKGLTSCRYWQILKGLADKGYLKQHDFFMDSTEPHVYQVTKKACSLFGRGEAYMRKKHQTALIIRYLIRAHFLYEIAGNGYTGILASPAERTEYLLKNGFSEETLPRKFNHGVGVVQVEEYLLTESPYARQNGLCIVYAEKSDSAVSTQLITLLERYRTMVEQSVCPIDFLILTETESRAGEFVTRFHRDIEKGFRQQIIIHGKSIDRSYQVRAICGV